MEDRQVSLKQVLDVVDEMPVMKDNNGMEFIEKSLAKTKIGLLRLLPSAQPSFSQHHENDHIADDSKKVVSCEDAVSREAVSEWLKQYGQDVLHGKYKFSLTYIWKNLMGLPSAQPEIIRCRDCEHYDPGYACCRNNDTFPWSEDDYCSNAERRTDA